MGETTVDVAEATMHLPELLDRVASGESITITRDGVAVAALVPRPEGRQERAIRPIAGLVRFELEPQADRLSIAEAIAELRELRKGKTLDELSLAELIAEARR